MRPPRPWSFLERDHNVKGLFVKEFAPTGADRETYPIVMVHGGSHGWWAFEQWQPFFADKGWVTYALSLRNHTNSYSVPLHEYLRLRVSDYVEDVLTVIEWIGEEPILLGHSMGGIIVQKVSERVTPRALVLVAPVPPGQMGALRAPLPLDRTVLPDREAVRRLWFHAIDDKTLESVCERLVPESPSVMNDYGNGELVVDVASFRRPILVVGGDHDLSGLPSARAVAEFFGAECVFLPDCGHEVMLEPKSSQAATAVEKWLRKVSASPERESGR